MTDDNKKIIFEKIHTFVKDNQDVASGTIDTALKYSNELYHMIDEIAELCEKGKIKGE